MNRKRTLFLMAAALLGATGAAHAQTVALPDSSKTTTLTATVNEQAQVTVPVGVTFNVTNIAAATAAAGAEVKAENIVLASATKQLKISIQAKNASFTSPGGATWAAGDVSWNEASWTNATGAGGTLDSTSYKAVATCTADAASCSTTGLVFTLAAKPTVQRSGNHTLEITWKFESI
jgi:hypothetical protein